MTVMDAQPVRASAPCRADLAGGTLDIWPIGLLHPGAMTVNVALPVRVVVEVAAAAPPGEVWHAAGRMPWTRRSSADARGDLAAACALAVWPAGGLTVRVAEQAPLGSGLGGSSAFAVAVARAVATLAGRNLGGADLVALLRDVEVQLLQTSTGTQDHWAALRGGALAIHHRPGGEQVERLDVDPRWLAERMSVFFTGIVHHSGAVNWRVVRSRLDGDPASKAAFDAIARAASWCRQALVARDESAMAGAIRAEWSARRTLSPDVCPPELGRLEEVARDAGALAVKACGAGGGGSLLLWHLPGTAEALADALARVAPGGRWLCSGMDLCGCEVAELPGDGGAPRTG